MPTCHRVSSKLLSQVPPQRLHETIPRACLCSKARHQIWMQHAAKAEDGTEIMIAIDK